MATKAGMSLPVGRDAPLGAHKRAVGRSQLCSVQAGASLAWGPIVALRVRSHAAAAGGRWGSCNPKKLFKRLVSPTVLLAVLAAQISVYKSLL